MQKESMSDEQDQKQKNPIPWDEDVDFLVVGSGGAGMTGAICAHDLGASTLVIEKADRYGGSTALSGGVIWVPDNPLMSAAGISDSFEAAFEYLKTITAGSAPIENIRSYLENAPRMMDYLHKRTQIKFEIVPDYPDYYAERPGGQSQGGRSCETAGFDGALLGEEFFRIKMKPPGNHPFRFMTPLVREGMTLVQGGPRSIAIILKYVSRFLFNFRARFRGMRDTQFTLGVALVARGRRSLMDRKIPLWLDTSLTDLIVEEGRVVGAVVTKQGRSLRIRARRGVLLAMGGFESNAKLRKRFQHTPVEDQWTAGAITNTGDSIAIGERVGSSFALMDEAWWCPTFSVPDEDFIRLVIFEKNIAGGIIVTQKGERFMNEAAPYNDVVKAMLKKNAEGPCTVPAYLVFDRRFRRSFPVGPLMPGSVWPDWAILKLHRSFFKRDKTIEGLARQIGADPKTLADTIERFNGFAKTGKDLDFGRGDAIQDNYYTAKPTGPNPTLGPIKESPYYAVKVWPGDLGTKGGMRTDTSARVLNESDEPIENLYAAGNCSAVTMGATYPGAGGTLGPALTFGFLAAEHAMGAVLSTSDDR